VQFNPFEKAEVKVMPKKSKSEELEIRIRELEKKESEYKETIKNLRLNEKRFRKLYEQMPLGYQSLDSQGRFIEVNEAWLNMMGYSRSEVIGKWFGDFLAPHELDAFEQRFPRFISSGEVHTDVQMLKRDGSQITVHIDGRIGKDKRSKFKETHCILYDITERKHAEEALQEDEESFRAVTEKANDGIIISADDGTHVYANKRATEITGYSIDELLKIGLKGLAHPDEIPKLSERLKKRLVGEEVPIQYETTFIDKGGKKLPVEISAAKIYWHGQAADLVIIHDITERKQIERAIQESNEKYRTLVEQSINGIVIAVGPPPKLDFVNLSFANITGYTENELLSMTPSELYELVHPDDREMFFGMFADRIAGRQVPSHYEFRGITKDKRTVWMEISSQLIDYLGKPAIQAVFADITERKRAEESLAAERQRLFDVLETLPAMICLLTPDYHIAFANRSFRNKFGESRGRHCYEYCYGQTEPCKFCETYEVLKTGKPHHWEVTTIDGNVIDVYDFPFTDIDGSPMILEMDIDITERKRAGILLQQSLDQIDIILNASSYILYRCEAFGDFDATYISGNIEPILGYKQDDFLKKGFWASKIHPEDAPRVFTDLSQLFEHGFHKHEYRFQHKNGSWRWIYDELRLERNEKGNPKDILGCMVDITERKKAEEVIKESEEKFKSIFENSIIGKSVTYFSGKIQANKAFSNMLGYSEDEFREQRWQDITHPDDIELSQRVVDSLISGKKDSDRFIKRYLHKNGSVVWADVSTVLRRDKGGKPLYLMTTISDITERKRMEEELLKAHKLESVGILAGGIAHDFNNILTAIIGNISLAKNQVAPEDEIFDLLNEAEMASTRAQGLTKQLLTFAKGGTPVKETASIKDIIKESTLFALRGSKSICEFSISEDLWPVEVDVGQFNQVINNIMINASQAMPLGGTIKVAVENLVIEERDKLPIKPGRYIGISITDQGIGIAEDYLSKIFDPYFTTKQEGSGLGLTTTYSIIKRHDGYITVESQLGVGTTFHIYLPASEKRIPEKEETGLIKGQGRILVMDDEASLRRTVGRMLDKLGYEPKFAKDGAGAIEMVKEAKEAGKSYDAVILDLTVPGGMGGKECIAKLLEIDPGIKAIVSSGYSEDPVLTNFREYGFKGMMPKPFAARTLSKVLHDVLKGEKG
jgi:PAS domain S-box-containing protein